MVSGRIKKLKRLAACLLAVSTMCSLSACGGRAQAEEAGGTKKLQIVTTIFPEYDWARNVLGEAEDRAELTLLTDNGADLHSYQPTATDIIKISTADLFIYVGGESDQWVTDALEGAVNKDMVVINLLELLGDAVREEEIVEGMEADHDHDHEHEDADHDHDHEHEDADHDHEHGEEPEYDEHVWLSVRNAARCTQAVADALAKLDPEAAQVYNKNAAAYREKLNALDADYADAVKNAARDTVLFGDRFPFRYLTEDYGLQYYAAFVGCSAETEASFETVVFLADQVDKGKLPVILTIEGADHRIAETVRENTATKDQKILTMDSMQSVTAENIAAGATYLSIMEKNLQVLREALS